MKRIVIPILVLALCGGGYLYYRHRQQSSARDTTLVLSGNIEAHESVVGFRTSGRIIALPVQEGSAVEAGVLLARLDDADYRQQVNIDEANVNARDRELQLALAGSRPQDIAAAERTVADARADLDLRRSDLARYTQLYQRDAVSAQTRDQADTAFQRAKAVFERAQQNLSEVREGTRKEQIAVNRATLHTAQQNLGLSRVRLDYTTLSAPVSGVITVRQAELGEYVVPGTPVVTLADVDHLWVRAYVNETDLNRVRWGQQVLVRTDSLGGKQFQGTVSFVSPEAEFTPKTVQTNKERVTLVYRIKVDVANPAHELKPGMPADILIEQAK
ncbi:MAG: efflux RND transporter periplasmic adaptor subunit [Acidobacteriota bacterium]|nr:efflux RND transporter periplasmic adaptor subunit [Acidobacteriota bacterium]